MNFRRSILAPLSELLKEIAPPVEQMALRLRTVERNVILPAKGIIVLILAYSLYFSAWFGDATLPRSVAQQIIERFFLIYLAFNLPVAALLIFSRKAGSTLVQRVIFASSFMDNLFLAAMTFVTGGFDSILYWLFLALIARNALSCPLAFSQLLLNGSVILCYLAAGFLDVLIADSSLDFESLAEESHNPAEPFLLRLTVLILTSICCYGLQLLLEKQRRAAEEAQEYALRQEQLRAAGRLAGKIAHQLKNPLGIINNAAYSLGRAVREGKTINPQQIEIIREEVERADQTITQLMGYARLAEGKVERIDLKEELDRSIDLAFPPAAKYPVEIERRYDPDLPPLMMQRIHLSEALVNLLTNAREAFTGGKGRIRVSATTGPNHFAVITIEDDGPGISKTKVGGIFQPYYTTKPKGTGLGLPIVKHNVELYGGSVQVESELGKGTKFILQFPTKTITNPST